MDKAILSRQAYDLWHKEIPGSFDVADAPWHDLVRAHLPAIKGKQILEIACGRGGFSYYLHSMGAEVYSMDFSQTALTRAQALFQHMQCRAKLCCADITKLPLPDESLDLVISCETLEHVSSPLLALQELYRVLKPQGKLYLTTPNYFNLHGLHTLYRKLQARPYTNQPIDHVWILTQVERLLIKSGFHIMALDGIGHYLPFPGRPPIHLRKLDHWWRRLMHRFALHTLLVANKGE